MFERSGRGFLVVFSAPSGAGKSTIVREVLRRKPVPGMELSISATTRPRRPGEEEGRDYYFLSEEEFKSRRERGEFVEWAEVHGRRYGTAAAQFGSGDETPLKTLPDYSVGEIRRIAETEQVVHLDDLICRRSTIAILGRAAEPALAELARTVGAALDWDAARQADEVSRALAEVTVPGPP